IVFAHDMVADDTRWRTGCVLTVEGCTVLVRGAMDKREIDILVDGPGRRRQAALAAINVHLNRVHGLNPECEPQARVPFPHRPDRDVGYDYLLRLEDQDRYGPDYRWEPEGAEQEYTVSELLDGVKDTVPTAREGVAPYGREDTSGPTVIINADGPVTVAGRDVRAGDISTGAAAPAPGPSTQGLKEDLAQWRFFALLGATGAVALFHFLYWIKAPDWRFVIGVSAAIFVVVYLIIAYANPARFYRRMMAWIIGGGLVANGFSFLIEMALPDDGGAASVQINNQVSIGFNIAWPVALAILAALEWWQTRGSGGSSGTDNR
ncbi:MAG: hypothetical protein ACFB6R_17420, partial [Alphaproteobacteria bacterium]